MDCLFQIKKMQNLPLKKIVLGYAPHLYDQSTFIFSPIPLQNGAQINYEVGSEEGVSMLLAHTLAPNLFSKDLDLGYLSAESNVGEEELQEVLEFLGNDPFGVILTQDFLSHPLSYTILSTLSQASLHSSFTLSLHTLPLPSYQTIGESNGMIARITKAPKCALIGSKQFALFSKLSPQQSLTLQAKDLEVQTTFELDENMRGIIAILSTPLPYAHYPYQHIKILK